MYRQMSDTTTPGSAQGMSVTVRNARRKRRCRELSIVASTKDTKNIAATLVTVQTRLFRSA